MDVLTFSSPEFAALQTHMNIALQKLLTQMATEGNEEGKLSIGINVVLMKTESLDKDTGEMAQVKTPAFDCKVGYSTKHSASTNVSTCASDKYLDFVEQEWILRDTASQQRSIFDPEEEE